MRSQEEEGNGGGLDGVLPEFYSLSFLDRKYTETSTSDKSVNSIALSSRASKIKHDEIVRKKRVETKKPKLAIPDKVLQNMRVSERKLFNRGHCVPMPGSPLSLRPPGSSPIVLRNTEMGSVGRNSGTFRPRTAGDEYRARTGKLTGRGTANGRAGMAGGAEQPQQSIRQKTAGKYIRQTQRMVLNMRGEAIAEDCSRSSWTFRKPMDRIICERPSTVGSSLAYAPVPDCAECILIDGSYGTLAGAAKSRINEKTTKQDKLFLISQRPKTPSMARLREPLSPDLTGGAPFKLREAPTGRDRPVWRKSALS